MRGVGVSWCFCYLLAEADPDRGILDFEFYEVRLVEGVGKCGILQFGGNCSNGAN